MVKKVFLFALHAKSHVYNEIIQVAALLHENNIQLLAEGWICSFLEKELKIEVSSDVSEADCILSLGGDGTLLRAAQIAVQHNKALLGINAGRLGFLTEFDLLELSKYLEELLKEAFYIEERALISIWVDNKEHLVLNDVVLSRGGFSRLLNFDVYCKENFVSSYFADGIILSTPTGSTGYSLSAGGPIMSPDVECFVITPICAHSLLHRSIVVSNDTSVEIRLKNDTHMKSQLILDGITVKHIKKNESIKISKSSQKLKLIRMQEKNFFEVVQQKLTEWK